jgi:hypothetical protein
MGPASRGAHSFDTCCSCWTQFVPPVRFLLPTWWEAAACCNEQHKQRSDHHGCRLGMNFCCLELSAGPPLPINDCFKQYQ